MFRTWLLLLTFIPTCVPASDFGPIATRNHRAPSLAFLRFEPRHGLLGKSERAWETSFVAANDFRRLPDDDGSGVREDYEVERFSLLFRQGIGRDLEWAVELPLVSRGGGFLDPIIDGWHEGVLGWTDDVRNTTPFGRSEVIVPGSDRFGSAAGLGDVSLFLTKRLDDRSQITAGLKLPTGDAGKLLGSGNVDAGLYFQHRLPISNRWSLHVQLGLIGQGKARELEGARGFVHQEGLCLVYQPNSRDAWIAQWQGEASALETGVAGSDATHRLLTFGYQRRLSSNQRLDLYFSEDRDVFEGNFPEGANIGPDFTGGIRWIVKF